MSPQNVIPIGPSRCVLGTFGRTKKSSSSGYVRLNPKVFVSKSVSKKLSVCRLLGKGVTRTNALESLVIAGYVRGLSTRDVEATLADALGEEAALSRSTVSRICSAIKDEFDAWKTRDLSEIELEYLYLDACHFRYHQGASSEPVMYARGITADGKPVFLSLAAVSAESHDAVVEFLRDMVGRGLRTPLLVITDGAPGLISAVEQVYELV